MLLVIGVILVLSVLLALWYMIPVPDDCVVLERLVLPGGELLELVSDNCKEGLPHTTGPNTIRMTRSIYNSNRRDSILTHERIHLDQKRRPDVWAQFVKSAWSYELSAVKPAKLPATYALRPNPDTSANPYAIWRGRYVFFSAYDSEHTTLASAPVIVYDLEEGRALSGLPAEWKAQFCTSSGACPHQYEHPYEISAEYATHPVETPAATLLTRFLATAGKNSE